MRHWFKVATGSLLLINCSITVIVFGVTPSLHGEPVAMFVANLCVTDMTFGFLLALIGLTDALLEPPVPAPLCNSLQVVVLAAAISLKVAQMFVALDMLVAVVKPLHYHLIMDEWMRRMLAAPWLVLLANILLGGLLSALRLESAYEYGLRQGWLTEVGTDCRWELVPSLFTFIMEAQLFILSSVSGGAFIYASVIGIRQARVIAEHGEQNSVDRAFFLRRFKSLKKIARIVLLFISLDIIGAGSRMGARWFHIPLLSSAIHFFRLLFIGVESWVYGLNNVSLSDAHASLFQRLVKFFRRHVAVLRRCLRRGEQVQPAVVQPVAPILEDYPSLEGSRPIP